MDEYIYKECRTGDEKRVEISYFKKRKERLNQVIIKLMDDEYRSWLATPWGVNLMRRVFAAYYYILSLF